MELGILDIYEGKMISLEAIDVHITVVLTKMIIIKT